MRRKERSEAQPAADASGTPHKEPGIERLRRKAGCILGLFTEPLVLLGVTLLAVVFGRAYLSRRAERLRARQSEGRRDD